MKYLILTLLMAFSTISAADDLLVGQFTKHARPYQSAGGPEFKKFQPLIGLKTENYAFIAMENSFEKPSVLILRIWDVDLTSNIRPFVAGGIGTGYDDVHGARFKGISALGYLGVDLHPDSDKFGIMITYAPDTFIGLGLRFALPVSEPRL
jgi:hypothetical protein